MWQDKPKKEKRERSGSRWLWGGGSKDDKDGTEKEDAGDGQGEDDEILEVPNFDGIEGTDSGKPPAVNPEDEGKMPDFDEKELEALDVSEQETGKSVPIVSKGRPLTEPMVVEGLTVNVPDDPATSDTPPLVLDESVAHEEKKK